MTCFFYSDKLYGLKTQVMIRYLLFDLSEIKVYTVKNHFLCVAKRVTKAHPMAYHLGDIKDVEDLKQKIQKQKLLKNKTIKACKEFLNIEDLEILEYTLEEKEEEILPLSTVPKIEVKKEKPEKYNPAVKPLFKTSRARYEYLMEHGCTCNDDGTWLTAYKESKEYKQYETSFCKD